MNALTNTWSVEMDFEILTCNVVKETDFAFLLDDGTEEFWCPKLVIKNADEISEFDDAIDVEIATWFCEKEGLI